MPLWKVPFDSLWISYNLLVFPSSPNMPKRGSAESWLQAWWMDACRSCRISSWGALCPDRERSLPLTGRSFKAKRQDDRWNQSMRSHGCADLELHFSNVEGRVIELLLYYFSSNKKKENNNSIFFPLGWSPMLEGQEQLAVETVEREKNHSVQLKSTCTYTNIQRHLTKALICRLNVGASFLLAAALLSFRQHNVRADNIYLKGAVDRLYVQDCCWNPSAGFAYISPPVQSSAGSYAHGGARPWSVSMETWILWQCESLCTQSNSSRNWLCSPRANWMLSI